VSPDDLNRLYNKIKRERQGLLCVADTISQTMRQVPKSAGSAVKLQSGSGVLINARAADLAAIMM